MVALTNSSEVLVSYMFRSVISVVFIVATVGCSAESPTTDKDAKSEPISLQSRRNIFIPPDNKVLLFIGQDSGTIDDYNQTVSEDNIEAVTLYSQIKHADPAKTLKGMYTPYNENSGTMDFSQTLNNYPGAALAIGLAIDGCNQANHQQYIANGKYDQSIKTLSKYLHSLAPRKVFLRIGYEFDGPWNCYSPKHYKAAFRRIALSLKNDKVSNVVTVWQSATWPDATIAGENTALYDGTQEDHLANWYPGDDVVDWIGVSVFYRDLSQWNYTPPTTPQFLQQKLLDFARNKNKPVMIAEAAPQGYRTGKLTSSPIHENIQTPVTQEDIWQNWYQLLFDYIEQNKDVIRAAAYINTHWDAQTRWQCKSGIPAGSSGCADGNWGDSRIQANGYIKKKWLEQVNNSDIWIQSADY